MSDYVWCHGSRCHQKQTQDRIRGTKGNKVLRTKKIKVSNWYNNMYQYFCSQGCYDDFANTNIQQIIAIAPRLEPLETPIEVQTIKHPEETTEYGWTRKAWTEKRITEINQD